MRRNTCPKCKHLYGKAGEEGHTCPTPEYIKLRDALVGAAAKASDFFGDDELERYAAELRSKENRR